MEMKTVKGIERDEMSAISSNNKKKLQILSVKTALKCEHLNIEMMIKIEIDDVTVNNTSSILSFLFCHLFYSPLSHFHQQLEINEDDENRRRRRRQSREL